jgi:hypothetical protein
VLPLAGYELPDGTATGDESYDGMAFATTDDGGPVMTDRWGGPQTTGFPGVGRALDAAVGGNTSRLGRMLAPYAIRYVVVVEGDAPGAGADRPVPDSLPRALGAQLDLEPVTGTGEELRIYRNLSWAPMRLLVPDGVDTDVTTLEGLAQTDLTEAPPALEGADDGVAASGEVPTGSELYLAATAAPDWRLEVDGDAVARRDAFGWANVWSVDDGGQAELRYDTPLRRHALQVIQVVLWIAAWFVLGNLRHRRSTRGQGSHAR